MTTNSKRKPYQQPLKNNWWLKSPAYRFYMLREGTSVAVVYFSLLLLTGINAIRLGETSFEQWLNTIQHPAVIMLNVIALFATLLHTVTWFSLAPKTMRIAIGNYEVPSKLINQILWLKWIAISSIVIAFVLYF